MSGSGAAEIPGNGRPPLPDAPAVAPLPNFGQRIARVLDMARLGLTGGPAICNIALTNVCNANCDFCGYARDKMAPADHRWMDTARTRRAIDILYRRGVRFLTFTGGEPTLHPGLYSLIAHASAKGMRCSVVTNGFTLDEARIAALRQAGLRTLYISIDAADADAHERNRGLKGVAAKIRRANDLLALHGMKSAASVTINRLISDFDALAGFVRYLGFQSVTFSYPKRALNSSSRVYSASSNLVDYDADELSAAFQSIIGLKKRFAVLNPAASLREMIRFLRGEEQFFPCVGGYKYFYLDYNFDVYRCDYWHEPMAPIEAFENTPFMRDHCTKCMSDCYRDASVFLQFSVSLGDGFAALGKGRVGAAMGHVFHRANFLSIGALIGEWRSLRRLWRRA